MKKILKEQLQRIHRLNYGKQVMNEGFLDNLLGRKDEKKADVVEPDVQKFFDTLERAAEGDGISQQERGSMTFQKEVESMQIGLILLGYELPRFGVDGLFGPETAAAVNKFTSEKVGGDTKTSVTEAVKLVSQGGGLIGKPGHGTHNASDWQSGNAWDVTGPVGAEVYSITNGVVDRVKKASGGLIRSGVKKIYGDQVSVKSNDGKPDIFYTHIDSVVNQGDSVKEGDVIGTIMQINGIPSHVHVGVSSGNLSDLALGLSSAVGGSAGAQMTKATPQMIKKLIELLKQRGVTSKEIQQYTNISDLNYTGSTDNEFYTTLLQVLQAPVTQENMKFLLAWRQAEGKAGKYNPFNTTWDMPDSTNFNKVGVKNYATARDGLVATVKTLKNGRYDCILNGLRNDMGADRIAQCESLKTWGTGDLVAKVIRSYNSGAKPRIASLA